MIKVVVKKIIGIAVKSNFLHPTINEVLAAISKCSSIAIVDVPLTQELLDIIIALRIAGKSVHYFDHHRDLDNPVYKELFSEFRQHIDFETCSYVLKMRRQASACAECVEYDVFHNKGVEAVLFDLDLDGYLSFLQGCGISYFGMHSDAAKFDGAKVDRHITPDGAFLADAYQLMVPRFSVDPKGHGEECQRLFQCFAEAMQVRAMFDSVESCMKSNEETYDLYLDVTEACERAERVLESIVATTEIKEGNVAFANLLPVFESGASVDIVAWKQAVIGKHRPTLLCSTGKGRSGPIVFVELPKYMSSVKLNRLNLPGVRAHQEYRAQIPIDLFDEFLKEWKKRRIRVR